MEVTLFGPGIGESCLVHCGDGHWISVDSALRRGSCWALSYLSQLGLNAAKAIRLIICTHWHTDHVRGLSELVDGCPQAQFVCSSALRSDEFQNIVARFSTPEFFTATSLPLREVRRVFEILASRNKASSGSYLPPTLAQAHLPLDRFIAAGENVRIEALSPSRQDLLDALETFAEYFVPLDDSATGLSPIDQNHASVVVSIEVGTDAILLGADLEQTSSSLSGWNAIVGSGMRSHQRASVFKVAHHGSENGHSAAMWNQMLTPAPCAIVTPYLRSGLPRDEDIARLRSQNGVLYATGLPRRVRVRRRPEVEGAIRQVAPDLRSFRRPVDPGVVRLRKKKGTLDWRPDLFGEAMVIQ